MKRCAILPSLLLCLSASVCGQQQGWQAQTSGTTEKLNSVYFVNESTGWIVGKTGTILKTTDAGEHWIEQNSNTLNELKSVFFYDQTIGWCSGDMGKVYKTADGGETWTQYSAGTAARLNSVFFTSVSEGYVCGEYGTIMHSADGGVTWTSQNSGQWSALTSIKFNNGIGRVTMMGGQILVTINGGTTWEVEDLNTASTINSVWFNGISDGIAVGDNGVLSRQTGTNWNTSQVFNNKNMMSIFMTDADTGWCVGQFGSINHTSNSWNAWTPQTSGTTQDLNAVFFIDSGLGWVCGNHGTILHTTNGGLITALEEIDSCEDNAMLNQNYPNPFYTTTTISWQAAKGSWQSLKVFDIFGNEVAKLMDEFMPAGKHSVDFNAQGLPAGIYFYQLQEDGIVATRKMMSVE
ncbi:MAG: T9SS type A sorting domain-containing protein [Lentimicrobium sp.]|nr:T9SS type A sorting domain-containing protein [Lentimicrobium sp.]